MTSGILRTRVLAAQRGHRGCGRTTALHAVGSNRDNFAWFETNADYNSTPNIGAAPATASTPELSPDPEVFVPHHNRNLGSSVRTALSRTPSRHDGTRQRARRLHWMSGWIADAAQSRRLHARLWSAFGSPALRGARFAGLAGDLTLVIFVD